MKNKLLLVTVLFLFFTLNMYAQKEKEIHVKVLKEVNGELIKIDTVLDGAKYGDIYLYSDGEFDHSKLDSILKEFKILDKNELKVISLKNGIEGNDSLKQMWVGVTASGDEDIEHIVVDLSNNTEFSNCTKDISLLSADSLEIVKEVIILKKDGEKVVIDDSKGDSYIWTIDSSDVKLITIKEDVEFIGKSDDKINIYVTADKNGDIETTSEIKIMAGNGKCKTIEMTFDADEMIDSDELVKLEEALQGSGEKVKVLKYTTKDGAFVIKAEISDCELTEDETQQAKSIGLEDKIELQLNKFKAFPNPTDGVFTVEFELEEKISTLVKVYNQEGKTVYSDKVKKFDGFYSKQIDLTKQDMGIYFIRIIQGDKSVTKKILKK